MTTMAYPDNCQASSADTCKLVETVAILRDEVIHLHQAVSRLEAHAAGRSVQIRDMALTLGGISLSMASLVWTASMLGWLP